MKFAINIPNFGEYFDARLVARIAREAEEHGWDGLFVWDHVNTSWEPGAPLADPWQLLTAAALATERIKLGTMVTPLARRRPWQVARQTVTLDHLSRGRLILGVGLGFPAEHEFGAFGEDEDARVRADKLDEALEVLTGLWSGEPFSFDGEHYRLTDVLFTPKPVQQPRIPIWVAQVRPARRPLRRAARWDGLFPISMDDDFLSTERLREAVTYASAHREDDRPLDVLAGRPLPTDPAAAAGQLQELTEAGATWFQVIGRDSAELRQRIAAGPPR